MSERINLVYCRRSNDKGDSTSIDYQKEAIQKTCESREWEISEFFADEGESGNTFDRPEWKRLEAVWRKDPEKYRILVWKNDRMSRQPEEGMAKMLEMFYSGVEFVSVVDHIEVSEPSGQFLFRISLAADQYELQNIMLRVTRGKGRKLKEGHAVNGKAAFGFRKQDGLLVEDPERAPYVPKIFQWYINGLTDHRIADRLNHSYGVKIGHATVARIITRKHYYTGEVWVTHNRYPVPKKSWKKGETYKPVEEHGEWVPCPVLIDKETFDKANLVRSTKANRFVKPRGSHIYVLQNRQLTCPVCGRTFRNSTGKSNDSKMRTIRYYKHQCKLLGRYISLTAEKVENAIWEETIRVIQSPAELTKSLMAMGLDKPEEKIEEIQKEIEACEKRIAKMERDKDKLADAVLKTKDSGFIKTLEKRHREIDRTIHEDQRTIDTFRGKIVYMQDQKKHKAKGKRLIRKLVEETRKLDADVSLRKKRDLISKLYPPKSIDFWPTDQLGELIQKGGIDGGIGEILKSRGLALDRRGVLVCTSYLHWDLGNYIESTSHAGNLNRRDD